MGGCRATSIALRLSRDDLAEEGLWGDVVIAFNAHDGDVGFVLPEREGRTWKAVVDTAEPVSPSRETAGGDEKPDRARPALARSVRLKSGTDRAFARRDANAPPS